MANTVEEFEKEEENCQKFANQLGAAAYLVGPSRGKAAKNLLSIVSAEVFGLAKTPKSFMRLGRKR